jgi:hypothetical protein
MSYIRESLMYVLLWGVGILGAVIALWQFFVFVGFRDAQGALDIQGGGLHLWLAIGAALVACACVFAGIFHRINKTEEFHITS